MNEIESKLEALLASGQIAEAKRVPGKSGGRRCRYCGHYFDKPTCPWCDALQRRRERN